MLYYSPLIDTRILYLQYLTSLEQAWVRLVRYTSRYRARI